MVAGPGLDGELREADVFAASSAASISTLRSGASSAPRWPARSTTSPSAGSHKPYPRRQSTPPTSDATSSPHGPAATNGHSGRLPPTRPHVQPGGPKLCETGTTGPVHGTAGPAMRSCRRSDRVRPRPHVGASGCNGSFLRVSHDPARSRTARDRCTSLRRRPTSSSAQATDAGSVGRVEGRGLSRRLR